LLLPPSNCAYVFPPTRRKGFFADGRAFVFPNRRERCSSKCAACVDTPLVCPRSGSSRTLPLVSLFLCRVNCRGVGTKGIISPFAPSSDSWELSSSVHCTPQQSLRALREGRPARH